MTLLSLLATVCRESFGVSLKSLPYPHPGPRAHRHLTIHADFALVACGITGRWRCIRAQACSRVKFRTRYAIVIGSNGECAATGRQPSNRDHADGEFHGLFSPVKVVIPSIYQGQSCGAGLRIDYWIWQSCYNCILGAPRVGIAILPRTCSLGRPLRQEDQATSSAQLPLGRGSVDLDICAVQACRGILRPRPAAEVKSALLAKDET